MEVSSPPFCSPFSYLRCANTKMMLMMSQLGKMNSRVLFVTSSSDIPLAMGKLWLKHSYHIQPYLYELLLNS